MNTILGILFVAWIICTVFAIWNYLSGRNPDDAARRYHDSQDEEDDEYEYDREHNKL